MKTPLAALLLVVLLSSCASYVADQIAHPQRNPSDIASGDKFYDTLALQLHAECQAPCIHYVSGTPWDEKLQASIALLGSSLSTPLTLTAAPQQHTGTVVLLHGYGANWSWMLLWGMFFQSRGFHTLLPDLPGQASTTVTDFSFGARDVNYLQPWLKQLQMPRPLIVVGHSMGTISATYLAKAMDADALVLLAPSSPLQQAAPGAARAFHPMLSVLIPDSSINAGTAAALKQLQIADVDTDLRAMLAGWSKPTLLISANEDEVIARTWAGELNSLQLQRHQQPGNHVAVLTPRASEQQLMDQWLVTALAPSNHQ